MTVDGNSVNMETRGYHHGDLRAALLAEGLRQLAAGGTADLSLRAIARATKVSATAVYRHFADKDALLVALCWEGDRMLAEDSRAAQEAAGGGKAGLIATGRAYVRFALAHPALFRLMMNRAAESGGFPLAPPGEGVTPRIRGLALLRENIALIGPRDIPEAERLVLAARAWSQVHGLAMLILDGLLPPSDALIEAVVTAPF